MKAFRGIEVQLYSLLMSALDKRERQASPMGKSPRYPLNRRLGGPQREPGHLEKRKVSKSETN